MKRLMPLAVAAIAVLALIPSSAMAWDADDCAAYYEQTGLIHPDCQWWTPPPPPPNVTVCVNGETVTVPEDQVPEGAVPGECAVVPPPEQPPEQPPVQPPPPPEQPDQPNLPDTEVVPDEERPTAHTPPRGDIGRPVHVVAGVEQAEAPEQVEQAAATELPYTGLNLPIVAALGAVMAFGGFAVRRAADRGWSRG